MDLFLKAVRFQELAPDAQCSALHYVSSKIYALKRDDSLASEDFIKRQIGNILVDHLLADDAWFTRDGRPIPKGTVELMQQAPVVAQ